MKKLHHYFAPTIAVFLLVIGVVAGIVLVQSPQEFREQAAPATTVFVSPSSQSKNNGDAITFSVNMNTGTNQVVGMDLALSYDPSVLTVTSISKGSGISQFDSVIRNDINNTTGAILYSAFTVDRTKALSGSDITALIVTATVKQNAPLGTSNITLLSQTSVAALTEGQNVIVSKVGGTIQVTSGAVSTNTPTVTLAPTDIPATQAPTSDNGNTSSNSSSNSSSNAAAPASFNRGDVNGDGKINILDLSIILTNFLKTVGKSDLNGDGKTNILDLSIILSNWGK
jgi:hypothetical protein